MTLYTYSEIASCGTRVTSTPVFGVFSSLRNAEVYANSRDSLREQFTVICGGDLLPIIRKSETA